MLTIQLLNTREVRLKKMAPLVVEAILAANPEVKIGALPKQGRQAKSYLYRQY